MAEIRRRARAPVWPGARPGGTNAYRKKQKNAQEAHAAIRPTSAGTLPRAVANRLGADSDEARLYGLVWARTMASQMAPAVTKHASPWTCGAPATFAPEPAGPRLKANGSRLVFAGHLAAYDHVGTGGSNARGSRFDAWLPDLKAGDAVRLTAPSVEVIEKDPDAKRRRRRRQKLLFDDPDDREDVPGDVPWTKTGVELTASAAGVTASQHWTQPPGRYTEGTLVKALEEKA